MQQMQQVLQRAHQFRHIHKSGISIILRRFNLENATDAARKKCCSVAFQGSETGDLKLENAGPVLKSRVQTRDWKLEKADVAQCHKCDIAW